MAKTNITKLWFLNLSFSNCKDFPRTNETTINKTIQDIVIVAPNPTRDYTTVFYELQEEGAVTITIANPTGRTMWTNTVPENNGRVVIDCSRYAAGYYPALIRQNGKIVAHSKLIIQ